MSSCGVGGPSFPQEDSPTNFVPQTPQEDIETAISSTQQYRCCENCHEFDHSIEHCLRRCRWTKICYTDKSLSRLLYNVEKTCREVSKFRASAACLRTRAHLYRMTALERKIRRLLNPHRLPNHWSQSYWEMRPDHLKSLKPALTADQITGLVDDAEMLRVGSGIFCRATVISPFPAYSEGLLCEE